MSRLAGLGAELLHIALMALAAPTLVGVCAWVEARFAGRAGVPVLQQWHDLLRLLRKQNLTAESASGVSGFAPLICVAATGIIACLVPSFALGMTFAPLADLLVIGGLLAVSRGSLALAGMDAGTAVGGMGATRAMALGGLSGAALLIVVFVLALRAGSLNLDLIAAMQLESGLNWRTGVAFAFAATVVVALMDGGVGPELAEFSGVDLALLEAAGALRLLVWFDLIGAIFLPFGMSPADSGPMSWLVGLACWLARLLVFAVALALLHTVLGRMRLQRAAQVLGVAVLISLVAALFLLAGLDIA